MSVRTITATAEITLVVNANGSVHKGERKLDLDALKRSWAGAIEDTLRSRAPIGDIHVDPETVKIFETRR